MNIARRPVKLDYIDAIRGIAIIMVIVTHTAQVGVVKLPIELSFIFSLGSKGVQLFFIASAFTLFRSYRMRKQEEKSPIKNFYIRRFFRIAPLYYLAILYYVFFIFYDLPYWFGNQPDISTVNILSNIFFLHGLSPYWINTLVPGGWSIAVEMFFYVIFPFMFTRIKNINDAFILLNCSLIFKVIIQEFLTHFQLIPFDSVWREFLFYFLPSQLPLFIIGFILFFLIENNNNIKEVSRKSLVCFLFLIPLQVGLNIDFLYLNHIVFGGFYLLLFVCMSKVEWLSLSNSIIKYIGTISFSMYIIHFIVISWLVKFNLIDFCNNYMINFILRFSLILLISGLVSTVTYNLIEIPFQNLAKKMIRKLESE